MTQILHIEVLKSNTCNASDEIIKSWVVPFLEKVETFTYSTIYNASFFKQLDCDYLIPHILSVTVSEVNKDLQNVSLSDLDLKFHIYRLDDTGPQVETMEDDCGDKPDELSAANHWILPSHDFNGLWESLIYDTQIKETLLQYVESTMVFSDRLIDSNIIGWNRVVLLHGPPGTGKTSLCKALAQKLSIRFNDRYTHGQLVEINSHSLFSKWFSESGKLVMKMFSKIRQMIEDPNALICVLIDEVESLTHARQSSLSGTEPSDSIRVVNAVLTQIDQIQRYPNVLILTTSNINGAIDLAFVDRADIKQYIGLPTPMAIYEIYRSCIEELFRTKIISPKEKLFNYQILGMCDFKSNDAFATSLELFEISKYSQGMSGRSLRKIPFLAHALFLGSQHSISLEKFLVGMKKAVAKQLADTEAFQSGVKNMKISESLIAENK